MPLASVGRVQSRLTTCVATRVLHFQKLSSVSLAFYAAFYGSVLPREKLESEKTAEF